MTINLSHDFLIQWHLTERCNLRCSHCYQTGEKRDEMSLAEIKTVLAEIFEMFRIWSETYGIVFSPSFNITGGEPFLRTDLFHILDNLGNRGFETYLLSNGTLINAERAKFLSDNGIKGVQISIEGPEEVHEKIRGKGSFSSSITGIKHLLEEKIPVTLNVTLSEINAAFFKETIDLAASLGVQRLGFSRLVPSGKGMNLVNSILKAERVKEIYQMIFSMNNRGIEIVTGDPVANQMTASVEDHDSDIASGGCAAGVSGLTILPDGTITPCRRLPIPVGNARRDSIREIWATSDILCRLRDRNAYDGKCRDCNKWSNCRGCRAIAYAYSQSLTRENFLGDDPQCFIDARFESGKT